MTDITLENIGEIFIYSGGLLVGATASWWWAIPAVILWLTGSLIVRKSHGVS